MISVAEARQRILAAMRPTGVERVALGEGLARVLAEPVIARLSQPPADLSAMDGYALRAQDGKAGARLRLIGAAPAGRPFAGEIGPDETVRLFTGSYVPNGADAILIQENAVVEDDAVTVREDCVKGRHIRRQGHDFALGDELLAAPRRLNARDLGLAAAGNQPWISVYRCPRIAILATGDEIALPGEPVPPGGIIASSVAMLAAFVAACGGESVVLPIAADNIEAIAAGAQAARGADLLVTTGGASVGAHDLVQAGLAHEGFALDFWKIAIRPGKPLIFGRAGEMPVLGLPGNPVSAFVCAKLFLEPALAAMSGLPDTAPAMETVRLGADLKPNDVREDYLRATLHRDMQGWVATPSPVQDSGMLRPLAQADALIRRPPFQPALAAGAAVEIIRLDS